MEAVPKFVGRKMIVSSFDVITGKDNKPRKETVLRKRRMGVASPVEGIVEFGAFECDLF